MNAATQKYRYRHPALRRLIECQFENATRSDILQQIERVEQLLGELDPARVYPLDFLHQKITNQLAQGDSKAKISGREAMHDLQMLVEDLSHRAAVRAEAAGERVLSVGQLANTLNVSTKTISRWRRQGLVSRRFVFDNRVQVGFLESSVKRFIAANPDRVERGSRFSQMSAEERESIPEQARRLAAHGAWPAEVMKLLAEQTGRSRETIRAILKRFDREHPEQAVFPDHRGVLRPEVKRKIHQSYQRGESIEVMAKRFGRTQRAIRQVLQGVRAERVLDLPLDYIPNPEFSGAVEQRREKDILGEGPAAESLPSRSKPPRGLPPYLAGLYEVPLLTREQEAHLFRKMNYLKHLASELRATLDPARPKAAVMDRVESLYADSVAVKNRLVAANLRLVVSIAKRHVGREQSFFELVSDGNMSLMRAVEKFDYSRGYKFSTYASWAIMKNFARSIPDEQRRQQRFHTGIIDSFAAEEDARSDEHDLEKRHQQRQDQVRRILQRLDQREQEIIIRRFGLNREGEPLTLKQVGATLGVTKERIRQIEARAMCKLRLAAAEERLALHE